MICIFLCGIFSTNAQTDKIELIADSLFATRNLNKAAIQYEKAYFFSTDNTIKTKLLIKRSNCYKQQFDFKKSIKVLERIDYDNLDDSLHFQARFEIALCSYLDGNFGNAESNIIQCLYYIPDTAFIYSILPLYALVLNELNKWGDAKEQLLIWTRWNVDFEETAKTNFVNFVNEKYTEKNYPKLKSETKAVRLATFVPGTGHWYAGAFWEGVASASFQIVGLGLAVYCVWYKYYFTAFMSGYGFFQRFYMGGRERVKYLVKKKNYERIRKYNNPIKEVLTPII